MSKAIFHTPPLFRPKFRVFLLEWIHDVGSAKSEQPRLTSREIIFEVYSNLCDHNTSTSWTDGRTDDLP